MSQERRQEYERNTRKEQVNFSGNYFSNFFKITFREVWHILATFAQPSVLLRFKTIIQLVTKPLQKWFSPIMKY